MIASSNSAAAATGQHARAFQAGGEGWRGSPLPRYGLAIVAVLAALWARLLLTEVLPEGFPFVTFFPAVILVDDKGNDFFQKLA